ncbi:MAG TPA: hypothetical protein PLA74_02985 [Syntrophales bacterium]|nr:hypothetical protein [Syntrophales bacterium]HPQ42834.1 hypothetical protein [Syntrophales bacterium]
MTHEDAGHYAAKHAAGTTPAPEIAEAIKSKSKEGRITCAAAHKIAGDLQTAPAEVGVAMDLMEMRLNKCQLGLFGYSPERRIVKPASEVSPELEAAIRKSAVDGRIPCLASWEIAKDFGIAKMDISCACEALGIKVSSCQLGAF